MIKIFIRFLSTAFTIGLLFMAMANSAMAAETIKIGAILPLAEVIGKDASKSMQLAVKQINAAGGLLGRQVELIIVDDEMKPDRAVAALEKMAGSNNIDVFVGGTANATTIDLIPAMKKYNKVAVWSGASSAKVEQALDGQDWFFHLQAWDYQMGAYYEKLWGEIIQKYQKVKRKKIFVAYKEDPFGSDSYSVGKRTADVYRNAIQGEIYKGAVPGGSDYLSMLKRARQFDPDIFIWDGSEKDAKPMLEYAKNIGFAPPIYLGSTAIWPADFADLVGSEGVMFYGYWHESMKSKNKACRDYSEAFNKEFKESPATYFGPLGYTNIMIVAEAIKRAGSLEREALIKALEKTNYNSPLGDTFVFVKSLIANHQAGANLKLMQWQNKSVKIIWPWEFATGKLIYPFPAQGFNKVAPVEEKKKPAAGGEKKKPAPAVKAAPSAKPAVKDDKIASGEEKKKPAPAIKPDAGGEKKKPAPAVKAAPSAKPAVKDDKVPEEEKSKTIDK